MRTAEIEAFLHEVPRRDRRTRSRHRGAGDGRISCVNYPARTQMDRPEQKPARLMRKQNRPIGSRPSSVEAAASQRPGCWLEAALCSGS